MCGLGAERLTHQCWAVMCLAGGKPGHTVPGVHGVRFCHCHAHLTLSSVRLNKTWHLYHKQVPQGRTTSQSDRGAVRQS